MGSSCGICGSRSGPPVEQRVVGLHEAAPFVNFESGARDLRYDVDGFRKWADQQLDGRHALAWLRVGFIRELSRNGGLFPRRRELDLLPNAYHMGAPPDEAQLFYVSFAFQRWSEDPSVKHADPHGHVLLDTVRVLEESEARDSDLVFMMFSSMYTRPFGSPIEKELQSALNADFTPMLCYWRIQTILLPRLYPGASTQISYLDRVWTMQDIVLAAYCQRMVSLRSDAEAQELVRAGTNPGRFDNLEQLFLELPMGQEWRGPVWQSLRRALSTMTPIRQDAAGFSLFCHEAKLAWLRLSYLKELAERGGPFPRRQELRLGEFVVGEPPKGRRKFVVSHGWETEVHPNPSGGKLGRLVDTILRLGANADDMIFIDFCSNAQEDKMGRLYAKDQPWAGMPERDATAAPYFEVNGVARGSYLPRTQEESKAFKFALWEMGRLYAFQECEVIVLPSLDGAGLAAEKRFPGGDVWGAVNDRAYSSRGWCCAEFSIALFCGRIRNVEDPDVQCVLRSREWPRNNKSYADMMRFTADMSSADAELTYHPELGVDFTNKGDRAVVKYNFFKMALSLQAE